MCLGCTIALITSVALTFDKLEHFLEKPEQFMARFLANRKIHIRCTVYCRLGVGSQHNNYSVLLGIEVRPCGLRAELRRLPLAWPPVRLRRIASGLKRFAGSELGSTARPGTAHSGINGSAPTIHGSFSAG